MNKASFLFIVVSVGLFISCNSVAQKLNLSVAEFEKAISQPNSQILDVRTFGEYQSGHLANALLADWTNQTEFQSRINALDKNKTVYTYCLSGARSNDAAQWLRKNGFTVYNLADGITAWKKNSKPIIQATTAKQITLEEYMSQIPANKTALVDFGAEWCPPCKKMAPVLDSLQAKHGSKFQLIKIDGGLQTELCKTLGIESFPTFIIYKKGKASWQKQGLVDIKEFEAQL
ncbi:thioredoxin domain-containing protein [Terrimonas pollutisoli]|uniref:thioredoxin domain-containing protein n=1 Tax=Terrimonas pollutisoli TaxID=3034147 RepID=UPI0023EA897A|nr:thioredoxin domain-containing protein [Terrimonas sp. H1YJ31]